MSVVIFTSNSCPHCRNMKTILTHMLGSAFTERNVEQDAEALADLRATGFSTVPVVKVGSEYFSHTQLRPIEKAIEAFKQKA